MNAFDPDSFLDGATTDGAMSTVSLACPEGSYPAQIDRVEAQQVDTKEGARTILRLNWEVLDDHPREVLDRERVFVRQDIWLDLDENGGLSTDKGKNVQLGKVRAALGQNEGKWTPRMLSGGRAMISVRQRSDKNDPEIKYAEVSRVAALT